MFIFSLAAARGWLHWDSMSPSPMHITQHCCPHILSSITPFPHSKNQIKQSIIGQISTGLFFLTLEFMSKNHLVWPLKIKLLLLSSSFSPSSSANSSGRGWGCCLSCCSGWIFNIVSHSKEMGRDSTWLQAQLAVIHAQISSVLPISLATHNMLP